MRQEIANFVFPVFRTAIEIIDALRDGRSDMRFQEKRKELLTLVQKGIADPEGDGDFPSVKQAQDAIAGGIVRSFLGVRYAMACWLDEVFIDHSPWREEWNEYKIEDALYRSNERSHMFWEQATRAQARPTRDAIEVYYLCVMLGFRGDLAGKPDELNAWRDSVEQSIIESEDRLYEPPPRVNLAPNVPMLMGRERMQRNALFATVAGLIFIPLLVILVFQLLQS